MPDATKNTQRIYNNELWDIEITLKRPDYNSYTFPANFILELVIEENILDWPVRGYLVYYNPAEVIEKQELWAYRMDARDELSISTNIHKVPDSSIPKELWKINHNFVIYDVEDLPHSSLVTKCKKVYFWDKRYQLMLDINKQWSTATTQLNPNYEKNMSQKSDDERSMITGDAIKALLIDSGFEDDIDKKVWDVGISKVLYTSPVGSCTDDDLRWLLKRHHNSNDPLKDNQCIFYTNREKENKFQLVPINDFFERSVELQYEKMFLEDFGGGQGGSGSKAPDKGVTAGQYSTIYQYGFVDTTGINNTNALISKPIYWYDQGKGEFGADFKDHEIQTIKENFKKLYLGEGYKNSPIFTLNNEKTQQYNIQPKFVFADAASNHFGKKIDRWPLGKNEVLFSSVFLNECLSLRMSGLPFRTRGMFIGIDRLPNASSTDNKLDYKLLGPWFLVKVQHIWKNDIYMNDVICTKLCSYESLKIKDNV